MHEKVKPMDNPNLLLNLLRCFLAIEYVREMFLLDVGTWKSGSLGFASTRSTINFKANIAQRGENPNKGIDIEVI